MSRTHRNLKYRHNLCLRIPKTSKEHRDLEGILTDDYVEEYHLSGINRMHKRKSNLPTAWDDLIISAYREEYESDNSDFM